MSIRNRSNKATLYIYKKMIQFNVKKKTLPSKRKKTNNLFEVLYKKIQSAQL